MDVGFTWDVDAVDIELDRHSVERAVWRFRKTMPGFVWDAAVLEGNPFTYPEVQTLMEGVTRDATAMFGFLLSCHPDRIAP